MVNSQFKEGQWDCRYPDIAIKKEEQGFASFYDHIFVQKIHTEEATGKGGAYDFVIGLGYTDFQVAKGEISDHLPVWAEFQIDGADDD